jgi:hypothetical protein
MLLRDIGPLARLFNQPLFADNILILTLCNHWTIHNFSFIVSFIYAQSHRRSCTAKQDAVVYSKARSFLGQSSRRLIPTIILACARLIASLPGRGRSAMAASPSPVVTDQAKQFQVPITAGAPESRHEKKRRAPGTETQELLAKCPPKGRG